MARKSGTTNLAVIHSGPLADVREPPSDLGPTGARLWSSIQRQYGISDSGGLAILQVACQSADRAEGLREQIDRDGVVVLCRTGIRDHPLLKHETAARSLTVRSLLRLGLDVEPVGRPGRPGGS
jgi:hypothetical protein